MSIQPISAPIRSSRTIRFHTFFFVDNFIVLPTLFVIFDYPFQSLSTLDDWFSYIVSFINIIYHYLKNCFTEKKMVMSPYIVFFVGTNFFRSWKFLVFGVFLWGKRSIIVLLLSYLLWLRRIFFLIFNAIMSKFCWIALSRSILGILWTLMFAISCQIFAENV